MEGYVESAAHLGQRLEAATTKIPLILNLGPPFEVSAPGEPAARWGSFVAGLHDGPSIVGSTGPQHCMQINLTPVAASSLFGLPMDELAHRLTDIADVERLPLASLVERLGNTPDWNERFDLLEGFLLRRLHELQETPAEIRWAWGQMQESRGRVHVGHLARETGRSHRHFISQFRSHLGLPPKMTARILRFEHAVDRSRQSRRPDWATIAAETGYFDQAHLHRDFHQFAGITPGQFARNRLPNEAGYANE